MNELSANVKTNILDGCAFILKLTTISTSSLGFVSSSSPFAIMNMLYPISSSCFRHSILKSMYFDPCITAASHFSTLSLASFIVSFMLNLAISLSILYAEPSKGDILNLF